MISETSSDVVPIAVLTHTFAWHSCARRFFIFLYEIYANGVSIAGSEFVYKNIEKKQTHTNTHNIERSSRLHTLFMWNRFRRLYVNDVPIIYTYYRKIQLQRRISDVNNNERLAHIGHDIVLYYTRLIII